MCVWVGVGVFWEVGCDGACVHVKTAMHKSWCGCVSVYLRK